MAEKMRAEKARVAALAKSYTDELLVRVAQVAQLTGTWLLLEACRSEAGTRGLVVV